MNPVTTKLSFAAKSWRWLAAWTVAFGFLSVPTFPFWLKAPDVLLFFPTGLLRMAGLHIENRNSLGLLGLLMWMPYLLLTVWAIRSASRSTYMRLLWLFCALLFLNVGGCGMMIDDATRGPFAL